MTRFDALQGIPRSTAAPAPYRNNGTNIPVTGYAFDAATIENIFFRWVAEEYTSGNVNVTLDWYADTASSGAVVWGAQLAAITPDTDTQDVETDALPTVTTITDTHLGTTVHRVHRAIITLTAGALDSIATGDVCALCISRQASNGGDTMTGDAILMHVSVTA